MRAGAAPVTVVRMTRSRCAVVLLVLGLSSGLASCSDDPEVCDDVDALAASLDNLRELQIGENALSSAQSELSGMKTEVAQLRDDAGEEYATEIDAVTSEVEALATGVQSAMETPTPAALQAVADGLRAVGTAVDDLVDTVQGTC